MQSFSVHYFESNAFLIPSLSLWDHIQNWFRSEFFLNSDLNEIWTWVSENLFFKSDSKPKFRWSSNLLQGRRTISIGCPRHWNTCFINFKNCGNHFYLIQISQSKEKSLSSILALWLSDKNWLPRIEKKVGAKLDQMRLKSLKIVHFECPGQSNPSHCTT